MENLNDKVWYRFLKVVFIIAFLLVQIIGFALVYESYSSREVTAQSFQEVGKLVKSLYNQYSDLSDEKVGRNLYEKNVSGWFDFVSYSSGENEFRNINGKQFTKVNIQYQDKYTKSQRLFYCIIPFLIISLIFWLVSRIFFYIFIKEKFLSGRLVNIIKGIFVKK